MAEKDIAQYKADAKGFVEIESLEAGGILIKDGEGHEWSVPAESTEDYDFGTEPLKCPVPGKTWPEALPGFHVEFCKPEQVADWRNKQFVCVTRAELGIEELPGGLGRDFGTFDTSIYRVGDAVAMKIPQIIADRRYAAKRRAAQVVSQAAGPTEKMKARATARAVTGRSPGEADEEGIHEDVQITRTRVDEPLPMR